MGYSVTDIPITVSQERISSAGVSLGEETKEMNHVERSEKLKNEIAAEEGCRMHGTFQIQKIPGAFHFSNKLYSNILHSMDESDQAKMNLDHTINAFTFGEKANIEQIGQILKEVHKSDFDPFSGHKRLLGMKHNFNYFVKVVPNRFIDSNKEQSLIYEYSLNSREKVKIKG